MSNFAADSDKPQIFVLSAKNEERLRFYAKKMVDFVEKSDSVQEDSEVDQETLLMNLIKDLLIIVCGILKVNEDDIDQVGDLSEYGFEPVTISALCEKINEKYSIKIDSTFFTEFSSIDSLGHFLIDDYHNELSHYYPDSLIISAKEDRKSTLNLSGITYTSQIGREPMEERLALIVRSVEELNEKLKATPGKTFCSATI